MSSSRSAPWPRLGCGVQAAGAACQRSTHSTPDQCQGVLLARGLVAIRTKAHNDSQESRPGEGSLRASVSQSRAGLWKGLVRVDRVQENVGVEKHQRASGLRGGPAHPPRWGRQSSSPRSRLRGTNGGAAGFILMPRRIVHWRFAGHLCRALAQSLNGLAVSASNSTVVRMQKMVARAYISRRMVMRPRGNRNPGLVEPRASHPIVWRPVTDRSSHAAGPPVDHLRHHRRQPRTRFICLPTPPL